jgi:hypothetical protein
MASDSKPLQCIIHKNTKQLNILHVNADIDWLRNRCTVGKEGPINRLILRPN